MSLKIQIISKDGNVVDSTDFKVLDDIDISPRLLTQVIQCELSNLRSGNAHTKDRSEVRGTGKKPWRQKGTGRARHGSRRSPIWVGGGVAHGPRNTRNWHRKINKSSKLAALRFILKDYLSSESVFVYKEDFDLSKTKIFISSLPKERETLKDQKKYVLVYDSFSKESFRGHTNSAVKSVNIQNLKYSKLINGQYLLFTPKALEMYIQRITPATK